MILKVTPNLMLLGHPQKIKANFCDFKAVLPEDGDDGEVERVPSLDSMSSRFTNDSMDHPLCGNFTPCQINRIHSLRNNVCESDGDINLDEQEEKARLIAQVMELQNTLDGKDIITR